MQTELTSLYPIVLDRSCEDMNDSPLHGEGQRFDSASLQSFQVRKNSCLHIACIEKCGQYYFDSCICRVYNSNGLYATALKTSVHP
jgi:hypothetical protein